MRPLRKHPSAGSRRYVTLGALLLAILVLFTFWRHELMQSALFHLARPFVYTRDKTTDWIAGKLVYLDSKKRLVEENKILSDRVRGLETELSLLGALRKELSSLRNLSEGRESTKGIVAAVLLAPPFSPYDTLLIDVGRKDGVGVGDEVKTTDGVILGTISEIFGSFSRATLFSSPGTKTPVRVGESGVQVEASGVGNGEFQILLPREHAVAKGDSVTFSSLVPQTVGKVESVEYRDVDFLQLISFRSPVNLNTLRYVQIVEPPTPAP